MEIIFVAITDLLHNKSDYTIGSGVFLGRFWSSFPESPLQCFHSARGEVSGLEFPQSFPLSHLVLSHLPLAILWDVGRMSRSISRQGKPRRGLLRKTPSRKCNLRKGSGFWGLGKGEKEKEISSRCSRYVLALSRVLRGDGRRQGGDAESNIKKKVAVEGPDGRKGVAGKESSKFTPTH